ncbi:hypothetical protein LSAT2_029187 [Lamellibrachia satsuma]|nr:hypothetical protein LSAT2_029187 [Lamellibrachia satsuma]
MFRIHTQKNATNGNRYLAPMLPNSTRYYHPNKYQIIPVRIQVYSNSFFPRTVIWWNALPGNALADLEGNGRNITIYRRIADRLNRVRARGRGLGEERRSERTAESCRSKIKSLQQSYKNAKTTTIALAEGVKYSDILTSWMPSWAQGLLQSH